MTPAPDAHEFLTVFAVMYGQFMSHDMMLTHFGGKQHHHNIVVQMCIGVKGQYFFFWGGGYTVSIGTNYKETYFFRGEGEYLLTNFLRGIIRGIIILVNFFFGGGG